MGGSPMLRALLPLLFATACTDADWQVLQGPPDDVLATPRAGVYEGQLDLQVRAFGGPLKVADRACTVDFVVEVQPQRPQWFVGRAEGCDLGEKVGAFDLVLANEAGALFQGATGGPLQGLDGGWEGWFHGDDAFYGESAGTSLSGPGRLEFLVTADATRVGAIDPL